MTAAGGLLIVNADDWGIDAPTTDAIGRCLRAGAVTSASGMVFMADSERAAALARSERVSVGLHLNLTEPFAATASADVERRQARIVEYFAGSRWRRWGVSASLFTEIERCIADQLAEFRRLYGCEPSHIDGHEHIHQALGVLGARTLPSGAKLRPSFTYAPGEKSGANRLARAALNAVMRRRFATPRYFFSIRDLHPALGGAGLEEKLALSSGCTVEVMTHPGWTDELQILLGERWSAVTGVRPLGSYEDL